MGPPRSAKRRPSFRRLLKTSGVKLDNKLKNKSFKQQKEEKKHRKEQRKLRQAVSGYSAAIRPPPDLHAAGRDHTTGHQEEQEVDDDDFLEALPTDMLEDEDQAEIRAFGGQDLSSWKEVGPKGRKRRSKGAESYEMLPRKSSRPEQEVEEVPLLPIKQGAGLIHRSLTRPLKRKSEEGAGTEEEEAGSEEEAESEEEAPPPADLSPEERAERRAAKLAERKLRIASLCSAIVADPLSSIKRIKELRSMLMESDPCVAVSVRKLAMVSLMEVFKDIAPSYRIRPITEREKESKVKKETQRLWDFEDGFLFQFRHFLSDLERFLLDWQKQRAKASCSVSASSYAAIASVALRCLCQLMVALPHFNFHNNILAAVAPLMNHRHKPTAEMSCDAFRDLLRQDKVGVASLAAVRVISGVVQSQNYNVRPEMLRVLLHLRLQEAELQRDVASTTPTRKFLNNKEKKKSLSRMQRKWRKAEETLQKELLEVEALENKERKTKLHTETLNVVFLIYFRILKKAQNSVLLPAVLEGLNKYAHLINLEFFEDLLRLLQTLVQSGELKQREKLHCVRTAFTILSGQGDVLNIDPINFYSEIYRMLPSLHAGSADELLLLALSCLDWMLIGRRKQVGLQRASSFLKRLSALSLTLLPHGTLGYLRAAAAILKFFPQADVLLDNEALGSASFLPDLQDPELANNADANAPLWELQLLQCHFHPSVRQFARHVRHGAPSDGHHALQSQLGRRSAEDLFEDFNPSHMTFNPAVPPPSKKRKKKKREEFGGGASLIDDQLQKLVDDVLERLSE